MKKLTIILISTLFTLTTSAFAGGMVGVKLGSGELEGNSKSYTAGSTTYAAKSGSKDAQFGAIFAELNIMDSPISAGVEYVPFDADISLNGLNSNVSANVTDYTTLYLLAKRDLTNFSVYAKIGYSEADIGTIKHDSNAQTTVNSQSASLEGTMYGFGLQSQELPFGLVARAEYTFTEFDTISVNTTSHGSTAVDKKADGDLTTMTLSIAKSF